MTSISRTFTFFILHIILSCHYPPTSLPPSHCDIILLNFFILKCLCILQGSVCHCATNMCFFLDILNFQFGEILVIIIIIISLFFYRLCGSTVLIKVFCLIITSKSVQLMSSITILTGMVVYWRCIAYKCLNKFQNSTIFHLKLHCTLIPNILIRDTHSN